MRPLVDRLSVRDPDEIELRAMALTLHGFYNGVESIFLRIARHFDGHVPTGLRWHRQLLDQVNAPTENRPPIIDSEEDDVLVEYLGFRHMVRHTYPGSLEWDRFREIAQNLPEAHARLEQALRKFASTISSTDESLP